MIDGWILIHSWTFGRQLLTCWLHVETGEYGYTWDDYDPDDLPPAANSNQPAWSEAA